MAEERARSRDRRERSAGPRTAGTRRPVRLTRWRPRAGVVAATTGLLGLSSARRAAALAAVVCALALTVSVPLRNYVVQRQELAAVTAQQRALAAEVERLTRERERLADPAEVEAQARSRLGLVMPGEVPYVVQLPEPVGAGSSAGFAADEPWYKRLWGEVSASGGAP